MPELLSGEPLRHFRHELRTPLNHIIGFADVLIDDAEDTGRPQLAPPAREIRQAGYALLDTIQSTLGERESLDREVLQILQLALESNFTHIRALCSALEDSGAYSVQEEQLQYLATIRGGVDQMAATLRREITTFA